MAWREMQSLGYDLWLESGSGGQEWFAVFRPLIPTATEAYVNESSLRS